MKIQFKTLDKETANTIAVALETYAATIEGIDKECSNKYQLLAVEFRHSDIVLFSEEYHVPEDDVQVLGKQEKGGEQWN